MPIEPVQLDVVSSCGPAGRIALQEPHPGCGIDPTLTVSGGAEVGLPPYAADLHPGTPDPADRWVLAGPVVLPGSTPATTVQRTCRVGPAAAGVRPFTCEGDSPEAACEGTLTLVPQPAAGVAP